MPLPASAFGAVNAPAPVQANAWQDGSRMSAGDNMDGSEGRAGSDSSSAVATPRSNMALKERERELRQWVARRRAWVAASTHEGEEEGTGGEVGRREKRKVQAMK